MKHRFEAPVRMGHKGPAIVYPFDPRVIWGERERYFVEGTLNGIAVEGEIGFRRGVHYSIVDDATLSAAGLAPDDTAQLALAARAQNDADPKKAPPLVALRLAPTTPHAGTPPNRSRMTRASAAEPKSSTAKPITRKKTSATTRATKKSTSSAPKKPKRR